MFTALIRTVRKGAVPTQFFFADLRAVVRRHDATLERFKMCVPLIRICIGFTRPIAGVARIRQRVQQKILVVSREINKCRLEAPNAFAIEIAEGVQERSSCLGGLSSQDKINVAIHQRFLGPGSVRRRDDQVAEYDEGFILMLIQKKRLPSGRGKILRGVHTALRRGQLGWLRWTLRTTLSPALRIRESWA